MKNEWRKKHWQELKKLAGNWIAYEPDGEIIGHDKSIINLTEKLKEHITPHTFYFVHPAHVYEDYPARFLPIYFKTIRSSSWRPTMDVEIITTLHKGNFNFLVDSGADYSLIGYKMGKSLGFNRYEDEKMLEGEGAGGGKIPYLLREVKMTIEERTFKVTVAWMLDEAYEEGLLGRDTVFDLFDIEFKQADEQILFKWRGDKLPS
jgi:Aspartyl protease